jgi:hypothetical protein
MALGPEQLVVILDHRGDDTKVHPLSVQADERRLEAAGRAEVPQNAQPLFVPPIPSRREQRASRTIGSDNVQY